MNWSTESFYKNLSDSELQKYLESNQNTFKAYQNMVSMQGGWILWDGDKQDRAERNIQDIKSEIERRKAK